MDSDRAVTELDFRMPEYRNANVEDYEFREDGMIVRKDRWKVGILTIDAHLEHGNDSFEVPDLVRDTCDLIDFVKSGWFGGGIQKNQKEVFLDYFDDPENPNAKFEEGAFDALLEDGSILLNVTYLGAEADRVLMKRSIGDKEITFVPFKWRESIAPAKVIMTIIEGSEGGE